MRTYVNSSDPTESNWWDKERVSEEVIRLRNVESQRQIDEWLNYVNGLEKELHEYLKREEEDFGDWFFFGKLREAFRDYELHQQLYEYTNRVNDEEVFLKPKFKDTEGEELIAWSIGNHAISEYELEIQPRIQHLVDRYQEESGFHVGRVPTLELPDEVIDLNRR